MDLVFRTLRGSIELHGLMDSMSISDVKQLLHQNHKEEPLAVPDPKLQRLVRSPVPAPCMQLARLPQPAGPSACPGPWLEQYKAKVSPL
jgi:hypothetical protein